jgi:hypothetical protein
MHTRELKYKAIKLREEGFSYSYISSNLVVAKSTLSVWLKDIKFIPNKLIIDKIDESNRKLVEIKRVDKLNSMSQAFDFAEESVGKLTLRDLFILGIGIYIGEGSKVGNFIRIANSDPRIIKFAIKWFKECFDLKDSNFKLRIHMYPDNNEEKVIKFWMNVLKVKKDAFYSSSLDRRANKQKKNKSTLPYGTAHLSVVSNGNKDFGVLLHRKILASIDSVLK